MYASRTEKNPRDDKNYKASWSGKYPIVYEKIEDSTADNNSLTGDYWIAVKGYDESSYTIIVTTEVDNQTSNSSFYQSIKLIPGKPIRVV